MFRWQATLENYDILELQMRFARCSKHLDTPCPAFAAVVVDHQGVEQWRVLLKRKTLCAQDRF